MMCNQVLCQTWGNQHWNFQ